MRTVEDKHKEKKARIDAEKQISLQATAALRRRQLDEATVGCSLCFVLRRLSGRVDVSATAVYGNGQQATGAKAVFGSKKVSGNAKLLCAAEQLTCHIQSLEERAATSEAEVKRLLSMGKKPEALRQLKKTKLARGRLAQAQSAADALEAQIDALEGAALNASLSSALKQSSKSMRKHKKLLSSAEDAIDAASEQRDMARDLDGVMADFSQGTQDIDEDELMEELESMMVDDHEPPPPTAAPSALPVGASCAASAVAAMPAPPMTLSSVPALPIPSHQPCVAAVEG
jgi:hypothetical protein